MMSLLALCSGRRLNATQTHMRDFREVESAVRWGAPFHPNLSWNRKHQLNSVGDTAHLNNINWVLEKYDE